MKEEWTGETLGKKGHRVKTLIKGMGMEMHNIDTIIYAALSFVIPEDCMGSITDFGIYTLHNN